MKRKFTTVLLLFVSITSCLVLSSCENNDEKESDLVGNDGGWAPESIAIGRTIKWSGAYSINGERYSEGEQYIEIMNATDCKASWSRDWGTYTYEKTDKNEATLSFSVAQYVTGNVRSFQYTVKLKFTKQGEFEMTGTKYVISSLTGTTIGKMHCTGIIY